MPLKKCAWNGEETKSLSFPHSTTPPMPINGPLGRDLCQQAVPRVIKASTVRAVPRPAGVGGLRVCVWCFRRPCFHWNNPQHYPPPPSPTPPLLTPHQLVWTQQRALCCHPRREGSCQGAPLVPRWRLGLSISREWVATTFFHGSAVMLAPSPVLMAVEVVDVVEITKGSEIQPIVSPSMTSRL